MTQVTQTIQESTSAMQQLMQQLQAAKGIADLAAAFVGAWGEIPHVTKNANNPHFGNDYADLAAVLDVIKPAFARHKLALLQAPGQMNGDKITMECVVIHASGQNFRFVTELPIGAKPTAQAAGSAYTYARRYQAQAIGGMAPVDDDGQAASASPEPPPRKKREKAGEGKSETAEQRDNSSPQAQQEKPAAEGDAPYAQVAAKLVDKIGACTNRKRLEETCRAEVQDLNDRAVAEVYIAKLRGLKAQEKAGGGAK